MVIIAIKKTHYGALSGWVTYMVYGEGTLRLMRWIHIVKAKRLQQQGSSHQPNQQHSNNTNNSSLEENLTVVNDAAASSTSDDDHESLPDQRV
mmetsp:Transcript_18003/g.24948  ORF Transcript_18003/g.24948 Transcript_18003/m.24948 type:complete len:93 (-) Transcript_18003:46-324(-)